MRRTVRSSRAREYFDAGISQNYYHLCNGAWTAITSMPINQLDDGLFWAVALPSAFNYRQGRIYGVEFTTSYIPMGCRCMPIVAVSRAQGKDWSSAQFLFDPTGCGLRPDHWIYLDHDQTVSAPLARLTLERVARQHASYVTPFTAASQNRWHVRRSKYTQRWDCSRLLLPEYGVEQSFKIGANAP